MRVRIALMAVAVLMVGIVAGWPLLTDRLARHLEDHLRRETGRDWRIGRLGFGAAPSLDLQEVVAGDAATGLSLVRVRVSAPLALVLGGTGVAHLRAEGLRLHAPLAGGTVVPGKPAFGTGKPVFEGLTTDIRAVTGRLRGLAVDLTDDGRRLDLGAESAEFDLDLGPAPGGTAFALAVDGAGHDARLELDRPGPEMARAARLVVTPGSAPAGGHAARLTATVRGSPTLLRIETLSGTLDGSPISGHGQLTLANRPALTADLRLDDLRLRAEGAAGPPAPVPGPSVPVPTDVLPDPRWLALFDADLRFALARLALGPVRLEGLSGTVAVRDGALDAVATITRAYEGGIKARYALTKAGASGRHRLSLVLNGTRLRPLLWDLVGVRGLDALATARIDLQATGSRPDDLPRSATGSADLALTDGRLDGAGLLGADSDGPLTRFHTLGGSFSIADGRAATSDLHLRSPLIASTGAGSLDLVARTLDLRFQPSVTPQRGRRAGAAAFTVPVRVSGPWHDPAVSADMSGLLQNPAGAVEALQDLGTGLFGSEGGGDGGKGLGEGLGDFLDVILPKADRAAPTPRRR